MSDYMTSAASSTANTTQLSNVPYAPVGNISAEIQARVTAGTVDDAGFGFAYGSCKLLDMLGYGSFIGTSNSAKAQITKQYLGLDNSSISDSQNPLVYGTSVNLNLLPIFAASSNFDSRLAIFAFVFSSSIFIFNSLVALKVCFSFSNLALASLEYASIQSLPTPSIVTGKQIGRAHV